MSLRAGAAHHVALKVRDLAAAERFYAAVLGLPVLRRFAHDDGRARSLWLDLGQGAFLALEHSEAPAVARADVEPPGWFLVALRIEREARAAWTAHLGAHGHAVTHETEFTIYVRDPEGNRVGLSHHPEPRGADAGAGG